MLHTLGGTVKIAELIGCEKEVDCEKLSRYFLSDSNNKITFGISSYNENGYSSQKVHEEIKDILEREGRKARFITPKEHSILSVVVVAKQNVYELNIVWYGSLFLISRTIAVQEFEEWSSRDFDRPYFDSKKGMLPPKAARMIVNIGLGTNAQGKTIFDPFCGMGTIPGEAVLRGAIAMGCDIDAKVIEKAKKNSIWLRSHDTTLPPITYYTSDATHISDSVARASIDAIITEPFMGSPKLGEGTLTERKDIKNAVKGLEKLYIGCFRDWHIVLKPNGCIVMALPEIVVANTKYFVKSVIDSCETLGYTTVLGPLEYSRPNAIVRRMFYKFKKKG